MEVVEVLKFCLSSVFEYWRNTCKRLHSRVRSGFVGYPTTIRSVLSSSMSKCVVNRPARSDDEEDTPQRDGYPGGKGERGEGVNEENGERHAYAD